MKKLENTNLNSQLPKTAPGFEVTYWTGSGYSESSLSVEISDRILTYKETHSGEILNSWTAKISSADKALLYQVFFENNFDLIKTVREKTTIFDGGNDCLSLKINDNIAFSVSTSSNCHVSDDSRECYLAVYNALINLGFKYKGVCNTFMHKRISLDEINNHNSDKRREEYSTENQKAAFESLTEKFKKEARQAIAENRYKPVVLYLPILNCQTSRTEPGFYHRFLYKIKELYQEIKFKFK